jgi:hypothetical protein
MNDIDLLAALNKADHCSTDTLNNTLAVITATYSTVCGSDGAGVSHASAWLNDLHHALPDASDPTEARFLMLLLIARKANAIRQRALDLLIAQRHQHPELQALVDELSADDAAEAGAA